MKITIKNLGAIERAEIDLKPLTVFVGHNGTGKSWTAYALASVFSDHGFQKYLEYYLSGVSLKSYPILDKAIEDFLADGSAELDIVQFAEDNFQTYINEVAAVASILMRDYLGTRRVELFKGLSLQIEQGDSTPIEIIKTFSLEVNLTLSSKKITAYKEENSRQLFFSVSALKAKSEQPLPVHRVKGFFFSLVLSLLHRALFWNVYLFPTERTALITYPITLWNAEEFTGFEQAKDVKRLRSSAPVSQLQRMLARAASIEMDDRIAQIEVFPQIKDYLKLADFLEEEVLQGKAYFEESGINHKELLFETEGVKLDMAVTSSMIKELMPLVLYLRYVAEPNDLIVIDEPEMNLHPAAQIDIIEFLAMLVNAGLNVLVTTHSPYIVGHLSNLIEAKKQPNPEKIESCFYLENAKAFIDQDKVSVYLFAEGTAKNILDEDGGINWETFWDVSTDVSGIYGELLRHRVN